MGIKDFFPTIRKHAGDCLINITKEQFKLCNKAFSGQVWVIDTSLYLYKYFTTQGQYIIGILNQIKVLRKYNITPIYIFDGCPPEQKLLTISERNKKQEKAKEKLEENQSFDTFKRVFRVTKYDELLLQSILDGLNVQWYKNTSCEADKFMAYLCNDKFNYEKYNMPKVHAVLTDDSDILVCGARFLIKDFKCNSSSFTCCIYEREKMLSLLEFDNDQLIYFSMLCGSDYTERIPRYGPETIFKEIKQMSLKDILVKRKPTNDIWTDPKKIKQIYALFSIGDEMELSKSDIIQGQAISNDKIKNINQYIIDMIKKHKESHIVLTDDLIKKIIKY